MDNIYAKGLYFNQVHPNTPDEVKKWKKGGVSVHVENFNEFVKQNLEHVNDKGYLNFDLTKNEKDGETFYSFKVNTWKPEKKEDNPVAQSFESDNEIKAEDIPFD